MAFELSSRFQSEILEKKVAVYSASCGDNHSASGRTSYQLAMDRDVFGKNLALDTSAIANDELSAAHITQNLAFQLDLARRTHIADHDKVCADDRRPRFCRCLGVVGVFLIEEHGSSHSSVRGRYEATCPSLRFWKPSARKATYPIGYDLDDDRNEPANAA